jgi:hypothetical protein
MDWKIFGKKRPLSDSRYYTGIFLKELRKTTSNLSYDSRFTDRDLYRGSPEYEAGALSTGPLRWLCSSRSATMQD